MSRAGARRGAVLACAALLLLAACGGREGTRLTPRPTGYHPDRFPDIRLPGGYVLRPERDQLAVTYAGGALRRYEVHLVAKPETHDDPGEAMAWFDRVLPPAGWQAQGPAEDRERRWRKATPAGELEELRIATGRVGARTSVDVRLVPVERR